MSVSVSIKNISKKYEEIEALKNIDLNIGQGELFGFIGPDGAGKTSLFRIITSLILPDYGKVFMDSIDVVKDYKKVRRITGYMPGRFSLYGDLSVEENLQFYASIFNTTIKENYRLIEDVYKQIEPFKKRKANALSGGMKQKLALSCALIHKPKLLILDEPTTGVDAVSRIEFWELLKNMQKSEGITILVSTPYMDEASLCDRVALMQNGNLLAVNTPQEVIEQYQYKLLAVKSDKMHPLVRDLEEDIDAKMIYRFGESVHVSLEKGTMKDLKHKIGKTLIEKGHGQVDIDEVEPLIEDCFMSLMDKNVDKVIQ